MTLLITSLLGGINQRRVVNMYEVLGPQCIAILPDTRESHCFISSPGDNVRLRIRDHIASQRQTQARHPSHQLFIYRHVLAGHDLPHDMMTQDPGCGHGDSFTLAHQSHTCHNWAAARRWPGDGWRPANCYFDAARYKGNTQHSTLNTPKL